MKTQFYKIYNELVKIYYNPSKIRDNITILETEKIKGIPIKIYPRCKNILLPEPASIQTSYSNVINSRKSSRDKTNYQLTSLDISTLLYHSYGEIDRKTENTGRRAVASAGAKFPLEIYLLLNSPCNDLEKGLYHFRPDTHSLEMLFAYEHIAEEIKKLFVYNWSVESKCIFLVSGVFDRTINFYDEKGYKYVLFEAGAVAQSIQNAATGLKIQSCISSGVFDSIAEKILDIDGNNESFLLSVEIR